jgi:1,4-alpha-glucan branching enzyme
VPKNDVWLDQDVARRSLPAEQRAVVEGAHTNPHAVLGRHGDVVRVWSPGAAAVSVAGAEATLVDPAGLFEAPAPTDDAYTYVVERADGATTAPLHDPYWFWPTIGDVDLHLFGEGTHRRLWEVLGARPMQHQGVAGTAFTVWAPSARVVRVVGDWNGWDGRSHPMRSIGASGVWELFVPAVGHGARYKFEVVGADGHLRLKADPFARWSEAPPGTASVVFASSHEWGDAEWIDQRTRRDTSASQRLSVYECHLGSWARSPDDPDQWLGWDDLGPRLADHLVDLGFTHVELMPPMEHPFGGSWGYQVSGYYSPTARHGDPDGFRRFVDHLHQRGIGVIVDWVPAHFPKDDFALARFDGTALYEHADPRQGEHPDWGTLVFNYGRAEVRNFLVANALYWCQEFHVDGLRVDAVASMLYLDYSRQADQWVPNRHGGRENLEAIEMLRQMNMAVHAEVPGVLTVAEESTAFPGVSHPVYAGGLGFTHKWNMGWMHDTLAYLEREPVHRRFHHHELTFGLVYAWTERFLLPLSHDEVVHLKGSLLEKMPGDEWQQFAGLRALYAWMWSHPGSQLLFMGAELAQRKEWSHDTSLDWHLLAEASHAGVRDCLRELNHLEAELPSLWRLDHEPAGFAWLEANDADHSSYAFLRRGQDGDDPVVVVANLTPVPRYGYRVGVPTAGRWRVALSTDDARWWGSGMEPVEGGEVDAEDVPWNGQPASIRMALPPLSVVWLAPGSAG